MRSSMMMGLCPLKPKRIGFSCLICLHPSTLSSPRLMFLFSPQLNLGVEIILWRCPTTPSSKLALVSSSIALPGRYFLRDQETLFLMLGPCLRRRAESPWTSLAGSTKEMGQHGATDG